MSPWILSARNTDRSADMTGDNTGIILMNMGGPDKLIDVRPFLFNLFSDREIIRLGPPFLQKYLAWIIARKRAPKSQSIYAAIGGGSPLKSITGAQAKALEGELSKTGQGTYNVAIAMRYWPPYADEALSELLEKGAQRIIALTLYPHYSRATTGSSVNHLRASLDRINKNIPATFITSWPTQSSYIQAVSNNILQTVQSFDSSSVEIVYSAHSLPTSFIEEGDPYVDHLTQSIEEIEKLTGQKGRLCYQSRSGPVEWLSPSTPEMLQALAAEGCKNVVMVPISFVSDHVETLYEINIQYKKEAEDLGMKLRASESLNTNPLFIRGLKELVLSHST